MLEHGGSRADAIWLLRYLDSYACIDSVEVTKAFEFKDSLHLKRSCICSSKNAVYM